MTVTFDIPDLPAWAWWLIGIALAYFVVGVWVRRQPRRRFTGPDMATNGDFDYRCVVWLFWPVILPFALLFPNDSKE
jgi:hypothetical protein